MTVETALHQTPENTSLLQTTKFSFIFPDLPFLLYFCQSVKIPAVRAKEIPVETPHLTTYRHAERLTFETLTVTALIDEDLRVYEETFNWLVALTRPSSHTQYPRFKDKKAPLYFDGYITINTNANIPNLRFKFKDCHPIAIGNVSFDSTDNAGTIMTADFEFRYDDFTIERIDR
jgi:hypothetical protein